jgi:hypothetical protein
VNPFDSQNVENALEAFSSESLLRTWIAGWIPVRVKKTRQNNRLDVLISEPIWIRVIDRILGCSSAVQVRGHQMAALKNAAHPKS